MKILKNVSLLCMMVMFHNAALGMKRTLVISPLLLRVAEEAMQELPLIARDFTVVVAEKIEREPKIIRRQHFYRCDQCIFFTAHQKRIETHYKAHALVEDNPSIKMNCCETCGFLTIYTRVFKGHLVSHQDEKNYSCSIAGCEGRMKSKRSLQRHMTSVHFKRRV